MKEGELTDTQLKLRDAGIQMKLALSAPNDDDAFRSCINAYLSHARSVTFVMQKESAVNPELEVWYTNTMAHLKNLPIMKFFNCLRTHTIHKGVVKPVKRQETVTNVKVRNVVLPGEGQITFWQFDGIGDFIPGDSGNVIRLCGEYYKILQALVFEWLKKRKDLGI